MKLSDYSYAPSYNKAEQDIAESFYLPCMRSAVKYDRISGYFGSTIYIIAWDALKEFVLNGGKMRIVLLKHSMKTKMTVRFQEEIRKNWLMIS